MQLGWVKFRSSSGNDLHCRLGGTGYSDSLGSVIMPDTDDATLIGEILGTSAPQPPDPSNPYAPGCVVGSASIK